MWESITILMGPPGSGKTTLGENISLSVPGAVFVSVGEYLREKLSLTPPFDNIDRDAIVEKIITDEFQNKNKKHLIIDCNPFPKEMWSAIIRQIPKFQKNRIFLLDATTKTLEQRLEQRNRKDHPSFSDMDRLKFYFKNVETPIKAIRDQREIELLKNETQEDYKKCIKTILKTYEES